MARQSDKQDSMHKQNMTVGFVVLGFVVAMLGMAYAAVPLYKIFCQVTGYGGTTQIAEKKSDVILDKTIIVRFDANTSRDMPWKFKPVQRKMVVRIGENRLAHFQAINLTNQVVTGTATFNVTPIIAGSYFNKIACFCFTKQTLKPGEKVDMPVTFFVDPEIATDPETSMIKEITLSYTFFPVKGEVKTVSRPIDKVQR